MSIEMILDLRKATEYELDFKVEGYGLVSCDINCNDACSSACQCICSGS